jgi:hypothetical protein
MNFAAYNVHSVVEVAVSGGMGERRPIYPDVEQSKACNNLCGL